MNLSSSDDQPVSSDWNSGIQFAQLTDVGMRRANNQDAMACIPANTPQRYHSRGHLLIVADGMGAHAAGELASRMAVEQIAMQYFRRADDDPAQSIAQALIAANEAIHARGQSNPEFHNMGTTGTALVLSAGGALIGHVGDSRVYRLRGGVLEQLTFDHSLVWEMEASGNSSHNFPKNVITRSLGPSPSVEVDIEGPVPIQCNDCYLVCSDGLTGLVDDTELGPLMECLPGEKLVRVLVDLANLRGGPDNISVIVARVGQAWNETASGLDPNTPGTKRTTSRRPTDSRASASAMVITTLACLAAAVLLGVVGMIGPMTISLALAALAAVVTVFQLTGPWMASPGPKAFTSKPSHGSSITGGVSPYRRYGAKPTAELHAKLFDTVKELRDAALMNQWVVDWGKIDSLETSAQQALKRRKIRDAIALQAEAIIETMKQLKEQKDRSDSDTVIE